MLAVVERGWLDIHAQGRTPTWSRLNGNLQGLCVFFFLNNQNSNLN